MDDVTRQVLRTYRTRVGNSEKLRKLAQTAKDYLDAEKYAKGTGFELAESLAKFGNIENLSEDELKALLETCLKENHGDVMKVCRKVQRIINSAAKIGINALEPEFDASGIRNIVEYVRAGKKAADSLKNLIVKESLGTVDATIRKNSAAADNMGLKCRIIRKYDGIGVHNRKDPCEWCLSREGEWDNYGEALAAGAFDRHPGCGCYISYEVGKTRTWSTTAGTWNDL